MYVCMYSMYSMYECMYLHAYVRMYIQYVHTYVYFMHLHPLIIFVSVVFTTYM